MNLGGVLSQAASGLADVQGKLATVSQNIANANTPGYVVETVAATSADAGGVGDGVRTGVATRTLDSALQGDLFASGARVAGSQAQSSALAAIDAASGAPGSGQDLASLVGALRDSFSTLATDPSNQTQQRAVVNAAKALASGLNGLGSAVQGQRQSAQDGLATDISAANAALATVGRLSLQIIAARTRGESTADLEDKRDSAASTVTQLTGAQFVTQANGDLLAVSGGAVLSTHETGAGPLAVPSAVLLPGSAAPALTVDGVAASLSGAGGGGAIGAALNLRDTVLPGIQTTLDGFSQALATGFSAAGLTLFTDSSGAVPAAGTAGFAQTIQVSQAVQATPSQVRDGAGAAGAAGNTSLISAVLGSVLATGAGTVAGQAADLVSGIASQASTAAATLTSDQGVQSSLQTKLNAQTGVSVDSEMTSMIALQNSYGANARVIAAVQAMWTQLLSSVQ
jgi:flagellar hook-associated protein 1 FlgK